MLTDVTKVHSFLGMVGYYTKLIPHHAEVADPLRELLRMDEPFTYFTKWEKSSKGLNSFLVYKPLQVFNPQLPVVVITAASAYRLGTVLQQKKEQNLVTVAFVPRTLTPQEREYCVLERDALSRGGAYVHWRVYS